jgi:hypothetical protein
MLKKIVVIALIITAAIAFLSACSPVNHLHKSGTYTVTAVTVTQPGNSIVTLQGITKPLHFLTDTLKPGHKVFINVVTVRSKKINVTTVKK